MKLDSYLKKLGINSYEELSQEEKDTYSLWEDTLKGRRLTDEEVKSFFDTETEDSIQKLTNLGLKEREDTFLKVKVDFLRRVRAFLNSPKVEQESIKKLIESNQ